MTTARTKSILHGRARGEGGDPGPIAAPDGGVGADPTWPLVTQAPRTERISGAPSDRPEALGRYVITRRLGAGGMGVVYEAIDRRSGQRVALKTLEHMDASGLYRLKQEFRSVADVTHPNLAALYELVSEDGVWFFTMEFVEGTSFLDFVGAEEREADPESEPPPDTLRSGSPPDRAPSDVLAAVERTLASSAPANDVGPPAGARTMRWATGGAAAPPAAQDRAAPGARRRRPCLEKLRHALGQLARAVNALHRAGKLHRDIKPANLLVTREGRLVVLDFGLVSDTRTDREEQDIEGTPGYMAPEQAAGGVATGASDWYAVGGVLYQALTGRLPFIGTACEILDAKLEREPLPPSSIAPDVPADLDALCVDLLRRRPEDRPSGAEVLRRLEGAAVDRPRAAAARPPSEPPPPTLLGRDAAVEALLAAQAAVAPGKPVTAIVRGRTGMGKTALVQHFVRAARRGALALAPPSSHALPASWAWSRALVAGPPPANAAGEPADAASEGPATIPSPTRAGSRSGALPRSFLRGPALLMGRCSERESVPYKAFDGVIDALTRYLRALPASACAALLPPDIADLAAVFPVLARVSAVADAVLAAEPDEDARAIPPSGARGPSSGARRAQALGPAREAEKARAFAALRALFRNIAEQAPIVIAIDDLQWGDRESAELVRALLTPPDAPALLFVAIYRSDAAVGDASGHAAPFLQELLAGPAGEVRVVEVGPLAPEVARRLALARLGRSGAAAEACAERIAAESEGSPFFLEELVRYARARGAPSRGASTLPPPSCAAGPLTVPTLEKALHARLAALPADARRLLEVVSVAGGPVGRRVAVEAAGVGAGAARALQELCSCGLLRADGAADDDAVDAYHDRIRDGVLKTLAPAAVADHRGALVRARDGRHERTTRAASL